jgi:hypothetical protein
MSCIADLESVIQRSHEIDGNKLEISDKPPRVRPTPKKGKYTPASREPEVVLALNAIILICLAPRYLPICHNVLCLVRED